MAQSPAYSRTIVGLLQLCALKAHPTVLPCSFRVMLFYVGAMYALSVSRLKQLDVKDQVSWTVVCLACFFYFLLFGGALYKLLSDRRMRERFCQAFTALLGTQLYITVFLQCLMWIGAAVFLSQGFFLWLLAVQTRIVRDTFEVKWWQALFLFFSLSLLAYFPIWFLSPKLLN